MIKHVGEGERKRAAGNEGISGGPWEVHMARQVDASQELSTKSMGMRGATAPLLAIVLSRPSERPSGHIGPWEPLRVNKFARQDRTASTKHIVWRETAILSRTRTTCETIARSHPDPNHTSFLLCSVMPLTGERVSATTRPWTCKKSQTWNAG